MQRLSIFLLALFVMYGPAMAQSECDIAGGAVRLHMTSEACKLPLNARGKAALAAVQSRPAIMACMPRALGRVKAEIQEALRTGGEPGVKLWCDLQQETLKGMLE